MKRRKPAPNLLLILGLSLGGVVAALLACIVVLVVVLNGKKDPPPLAAAPPPVTTPPVPTPPVQNPNPNNPPPVVNPAPVVQPPPPGAAGGLAPEVLDKVKKATVYIRVTDKDGGKASGSGFFEAGSNLVLTNAHVLGMLDAGASPPARIEVVLRSGEKDERTCRCEIVTVDRLSDLAVLNPNLQAAGVPAPALLTVGPSDKLLETQQVYIFGFPLGESLGKNITVSTSSISSLRKDHDGLLTQVQVNGGMHPGNSGGPVVDAAGNLIGVAVAGIRNTQINFAIPTDAVLSVLNGRMSGVRVGETHRKDSQITVPVRVETIDPRWRITKLTVDYWIGDPNGSFPPSATQPAAPPGGAERLTVSMAYRPAFQFAEADVVLPVLPPAGKVLWVQPAYVNGAGKAQWVAGTSYPLSPPIDDKPAVLTFHPAVGKLRLTLKSTATLRLKTAEGERHSLLKNIETQLSEETLAVAPNGVSTVRLGIEKFAIGLSIDDKGPPQTDRMKRIVQDVGQLNMSLTVDTQGGLMQKKLDLSRAPKASRDALSAFGEQMLQSLDLVTVGMVPAPPNSLIQTGQPWQGTRIAPIDLLDDGVQSAAIDMTYTYRGVRKQDGVDMGVIALNGVLRPAKDNSGTQTGTVTGTALVDLATGRVVQTTAVFDVNLDLGSGASVSGKLEVRLTRSVP